MKFVYRREKNMVTFKREPTETNGRKFANSDDIGTEELVESATRREGRIARGFLREAGIVANICNSPRT
jgi:hypothetical protein